MRFAPRLRVRPRWLAVSLLVTLLVAATLAYLAAPPVRRWLVLRQLHSADLERRERALNYVIRRAPDDDAVAQGAIARLDVDDEENFLQIVSALDRAGRWRHPPVPAAAWLRWLGLMVEGGNSEGRIAAAQGLAQMDIAAAGEAGAELLRRLLADENADVRYNALVSAASLAASPGGAEARFAHLIAAATADPAAAVARQAWVLLGLRREAHAIPDAWRAAAPPVAAAMIWALLMTDPAAAEPALAALDEESAHLEVRAMAAYALHLSDRADARERLSALIAQHLRARERSTVPPVVVLRALLALPAPPPAEAAAEDGVMSLQSGPLFSRSLRDAVGETAPLLWAALHREAWWIMVLERMRMPARDPAAQLALVEGLPRGEFDLPIDDLAPPLLRLASISATRSPRPEDLQPLLAAPEPTLRDLAALVAVERLTPEQNGAMTAALLSDYDDNAKMGGAMLAGLAGIEHDLLVRKARDEDVWVVQQVMKLGLWLQDRAPVMDETAPALLARDDVPRSTVLLALLHKGDPAALEYLLNPRGEPWLNLPRLLVDERWWHALRRYLPPEAPPLWLWGDPALQEFQIEVLRNWYLLEQAKAPRATAGN